jgi:hypothetical protein
MKTRSLVLALGLTVVALVVAACGKQTITTTGGKQLTYATAPNALLVRVEHSGGFVPVEAIFTALPLVSVYGDGTVLTQGPQIAIYPGPALPNLQVRKLDQEGIEALLQAAADAGLTGPAPDYGQPPIADAPDTVVTINVNDQTYRHSANALGDFGGGDLGLTPAQTRARAALATFVSSVTDLPTLVGGEHITAEEPYDISAWRLQANRVDTLPTGEPAPSVKPWPVAGVSLAAIGPCAAVTGEQAAAVTEVMEQANQLTYFTEGGVTYQVLARPLLPDETGCASAS